MSLVSTFVKVGKQYYKNPVYRGRGWFVCFDDDDPIELVIQDIRTFDKVIAELGWTGKIREITKAPCGQRLFNGKFRDAKAFWLHLKGDAMFPVPQEHEGIFTKKQLPECVIYGT